MKKSLIKIVLKCKSLNVSYKILNLKFKEVGIAIKLKKQVVSYFEPVESSYVTVIHQAALVTISSNICSQMHVQIKYSISHLQDLIPTVASTSQG